MGLHCASNILNGVIDCTFEPALSMPSHFNLSSARAVQCVAVQYIGALWSSSAAVLVGFCHCLKYLTPFPQN